MVCTRDGRRAYIGCNDGTIRVWNLESGLEVARLQGHTACIYDVALSPDNSLLASGGRDKTVRIWNATTAEPLATCVGHEQEIIEVQFSSDSRYVVSTGHEGVRIWSVKGGSALLDFRKTRTNYYGFGNWTWWVEAASLSPDRRWLVFGGHENAISLYDVREERLVKELSGHKVQVVKADNPQQYPQGLSQNCISVNGLRFINNDVFLSVGVDQTIRLWDRSTGRQIQQLDIDMKPWRFEVSADGRRALIGCHDGTVRLLALPHLPKQFAAR